MNIEVINFGLELRKTANWSAGKYLSIDPHWLECMDIINSIVGKSDADTVLDAGCGEGYHLQKICIFKNIKKVIGVDFSENMLVESQKRLMRIRNSNIYNLLNEDFRNTSMDSNSIDVIICMNNTYGLIIGNSIESADAERRKALKEFYRILKRRGKVILSILNIDKYVMNGYTGSWNLVEDISDFDKGDFVLETNNQYDENHVFFSHWFKQEEVIDLANEFDFRCSSYCQREMQHIFVLEKM